MGSRAMEHLSNLEQDLEMELELDGDSETDDDALEAEAGDEGELDGEPSDSFLESDRSYGGRLALLAEREFESEAELDAAVGEVLDDMEREYFFGRFGKLVSRAGRSLVKRGMRLAKNLPVAKVVSGVTSLARGNLKGMLGSLIKAGLASAIPGGAMLGPLLGSLTGGAKEALRAGQSAVQGSLGGLDLGALGAEGEVESEDPERFERLAEIAQTAYQELAGRLTEQATQPIAASRIALGSMEAAVRKHSRHSAGGNRTRRITLRAGERLIITRG